MELMKWFSKPAPAIQRLPSGSFTVDRQGNLLTSTVASAYPAGLLGEIAHEVLRLFREARTASLPLSEVSLHFADLHITARELQSGALVFLTPQKTFATNLMTRSEL
ncbi:MAG: hypothetical protein WDM76_12455 [Limisphaerales bacterium]